jgi:hypothetical protein
VSKQSRDVLDEAGIVTTDPAVVRRAREFITRLCTEPVRREYLRACKKAYRPPRFARQASGARPGQRRAKHAKLWLVALREGKGIPDRELDRYEKGEHRAEKLVKAPERSKTDSFHWWHKPRMAKELEVGDWIIQSVRREDKTIVVYPPGQLLLIDNYVRDPKKRKERWVFHLEMPKRGQTLSWPPFRKAVKRILGEDLKRPRTKPVRDVEAADGFLGLWTAGGRVARG